MTEALLLEDRTRSATPVTSDLTNSEYWLGYRRGLRRAQQQKRALAQLARQPVEKSDPYTPPF